MMGERPKAAVTYQVYFPGRRLFKENMAGERERMEERERETREIGDLSETLEFFDFL